MQQTGSGGVPHARSAIKYWKCVILLNEINLNTEKTDNFE